MKLPIYIAKNYLLGKKSLNAIHWLSIISVVGMMFSTMALVLVLSVYNGFENLVIGLFDTFRADIVIEPAKGKFFEADASLKEILNDEEIEAFSYVVEENALFDYDGKQYFAIIKGVDQNYNLVNDIDSNLIDGVFNVHPETKNAVLGLGVAKALSISLLDQFNSFRVFMPKANAKLNSINPMQSVNIKNLNPTGFFSIEKEFDSKYVFAPLKLVQDLVQKPGKLTSIELVLEDENQMNKKRDQLKTALGEKFTVKNRFEQDSTIYRVMQSEKWVAFLILSFILLIAAFNILGSLSMMVMDKRKDISILQAMGADKRDIYQIFLNAGLILSMFGAICGLVLAIIIGLLQKQFGIIKLNNNGTFLIDALPLQFKTSDFLIIAVTIVFIGLLASYFPARRAANLEISLRS